MLQKNKTIVYVEDDREDQEFLREAFLRVHDHHLQILSESRELFSFLDKRSQDVCLLILDINLPYLNGIEILYELKKRDEYKDIPVVMFTTGANSPQARELRNLGVEVIEKPSTFSALQTIADTLLQYCLHNGQ